MALSRKHSLVMVTPDDPAYENKPSDWNAGHALSGATSGGIPYFSSATTEDTSALLASDGIMVGGGAGAAPTTPVNLGASESIRRNSADSGWEGFYAKNVVSVKDPAYGAIGDGTTNDTAAIQAAYDTLDAESGGALFFPRGMYAFNLNILKDNVWLVMDGADAAMDAGNPTVGFVPWDTTIPVVKVGYTAETDYIYGTKIVAGVTAVGPNGRGQKGIELCGGSTHTTLDVLVSAFTDYQLDIWGDTKGNTTVRGRAILVSSGDNTLALANSYAALKVRSVSTTQRIGDFNLLAYVKGPLGTSNGSNDTGYTAYFKDCGAINMQGWFEVTATEHGVYIDDTNVNTILQGNPDIDSATSTDVLLHVKGSTAARKTCAFWLNGRVDGYLRWGVTAPGEGTPGGTSTGVNEGFYSASVSQALSGPKIIGSSYYVENGQAAVAAPSGVPNIAPINTATQTSLTVSTCAASATLNRIRITTTAAHGLSSGDRVTVASVTGTTEANGDWQINVIDATNIDLKYSYFVNAYVGGPGTVIRVDQLNVNAGASNNAITVSQGVLVQTGNMFVDGSAGIAGAPVEEALNVGPKDSNNVVKINAGTTGTGAVYFSDGATNPGMVKYDHSVDEIILRAATADQAVVTTACTAPASDNAKNLGEAAGTRRWKEIFCVNATINTSDARDKTDIQDLTAGLDLVNRLRPVSYKWKVGQNIITTEEIDSFREVQKLVEIDRVVTRAVKDGAGRIIEQEVVIKVTEPLFDENGQPVMEKVPCKDHREIVTPEPGKRTHYGLIAQELQAVAPENSALHILSDPKDPASKQGWRPTELIPVLIKAVQELSAQVEELKAKLP